MVEFNWSVTIEKKIDFKLLRTANINIETCNAHDTEEKTK